MSNPIKTPAFPTFEGDTYDGMSQSDYAAISLRITTHSDDDLNDWIGVANRRDTAHRAMQAMLTLETSFTLGNSEIREMIALRAWEMADAMAEAE